MLRDVHRDPFSFTLIPFVDYLYSAKSLLQLCEKPIGCISVGHYVLQSVTLISFIIFMQTQCGFDANTFIIIRQVRQFQSFNCFSFQGGFGPPRFFAFRISFRISLSVNFCILTLHPTTLVSSHSYFWSPCFQLVPVSLPVLPRSDESRHWGLFPDVKGETFSLLPFKAVGLLQWPFIRSGKFSCILVC